MSSILQLVSNTWLTPESAVFTKLQYRFAPSSPDLAGPGSQRQTGDSLIAALETRMADLVASSSPNPAVFGSQHQTAAGLTEALESRLIDLADGIRSTRSVMWDINMGPDYMGGVMVGKDVCAFIADHCADLRQGMIKRMQSWGRLEADGVACAKVHNMEIMRFRYFALRSLTDIANLVWTYQVDPFQLSKKSSSVDFEWSTLCWVIGDLVLAFVNILQIIDHVDLDIHSSDKYPIANVLLTAAATRRAFRQAERDIVSIMITLCHHLVNRSKGPTGLTCSATMSSEQRQAMVNRIGAEIEMYMLEMRGQQEIDGKMRFQILRATGISSMDLLTPEQVEGLKDTLHELFDPKSPLSDVVAALSRVRLYGNSALKTSPKLRSYIDGRISHHVPAKSPYTTVTLATDSNFQAAALGKPAVVLVDKKRLLRNLKADLRCEHWRAKTMMLILMRNTLAQKQVKKADREPSIPRLVMSPLSMAGTFKACGETSGSSDSEGEDEDDIEYVDDRDEAPLLGRKDEQKEKKKGKLSFKRFIPFVKSK